MAASEVVGVHYRTGRPARIRLKGARIAEVEPVRGSAKGLPWIAPGLVDLQVNGYAGHDFNSARVSEDAAGKVARELLKEGVTSFCPTVITGSGQAIEDAVRAIAKGEADAGGGVAGIHIEGPFISPEDGARGAHAQAHVRPPDWGLLERWRRAAEGRVRILTMSPEWPGSAEFIGRCARSGLMVAIGHTAATPPQIREAAAAGARLSTHLGNGTHIMLRRHPNYVWEQMAEDRLWASLIADGFHLPDSFLKVALRAKGRQAVLVSDSVAQAGLKPGVYETAACGRVVLTEEGKLHLERDANLLAGSARPLVRGIERLTLAGICGLAEAWDRASTGPAELLGLPQAEGLAAGAPADVAAFEWDGERISVRRTWKKGRLVHGE